MAAAYLNNVRVLCKEGCEEKFIAETEEWVTPQISPMVAGDSEGKPKPGPAETSNDFVGPS